MHWRRKWQPTPMFLPGESQRWGSLVGCRLWGRTESDMTVGFSLTIVKVQCLPLVRPFLPRGNFKKFSSICYYEKSKHQLLLLLLLSRFSRVRLCATPQTAAHQAPLSLGFSRQEHWSGLPFPSPMHESEKSKRSRSLVSDS